VRSAGATGAIVGRAALEGSLDLTEAIQQLG
jgi:phosphoribosylformimino-5-aminoimidazole carboxamide ribonucleotide (ProFAR) isomerase